MGFPGGRGVKNSPAMLETWVQSLDWKVTLEEGTATHSSILAWRILMDRGAWWASERVRHDCTIKHSTVYAVSGVNYILKFVRIPWPMASQDIPS